MLPQEIWRLLKLVPADSTYHDYHDLEYVPHSFGVHDSVRPPTGYIVLTAGENTHNWLWWISHKMRYDGRRWSEIVVPYFLINTVCTDANYNQRDQFGSALRAKKMLLTFCESLYLYFKQCEHCGTMWSSFHLRVISPLSYLDFAHFCTSYISDNHLSLTSRLTFRIVVNCVYVYAP